MLINNIGSMARKLQDEFRAISSSLSHQGVKGDLREEALKNTLRELLPVKYSVGKGIIVDATKVQSRQQDFIIYDGFASPVFLKRESQLVLPVESVYATTEVKSTLNKHELEKAINNATSVKALNKSLFHPPGFVITPSNFIYSTVFAYTCDVDMMTLKKRFDEMNRLLPFEHQLSTVCVLDKGCIVNVRRDNVDVCEIQPSENTFTVVRRLSTELSLYMYYLMLQFHLSSNIVYPPNLLKYANQDKPFVESPISFDIDSLRDAGEILIDDLRVLYSDWERYLKIKPLYNKSLTDFEVQQAGFSREELNRELEWGNLWYQSLAEARARSLAKEASDSNEN